MRHTNSYCGDTRIIQRPISTKDLRYWSDTIFDIVQLSMMFGCMHDALWPKDHIWINTMLLSYKYMKCIMVRLYQPPSSSIYPRRRWGEVHSMRFSRGWTLDISRSTITRYWTRYIRKNVKTLFQYELTEEISYTSPLIDELYGAYFPSSVE